MSDNTNNTGRGPRDSQWANAEPSSSAAPAAQTPLSLGQAQLAQSQLSQSRHAGESGPRGGSRPQGQTRGGSSFQGAPRAPRGHSSARGGASQLGGAPRGNSSTRGGSSRGGGGGGARPQGSPAPPRRNLSDRGGDSSSSTRGRRSTTRGARTQPPSRPNNPNNRGGSSRSQARTPPQGQGPVTEPCCGGTHNTNACTMSNAHRPPADGEVNYFVDIPRCEGGLGDDDPNAPPRPSSRLGFYGPPYPQVEYPDSDSDSGSHYGDSDASEPAQQREAHRVLFPSQYLHRNPDPVSVSVSVCTIPSIFDDSI
ncbi:hypothetical protein B0H63DRAFT_515250 [Podospora didyma]|uniref:Uncharacterized protein n=1 Tax=Podospora didyma TaxID=330526 RepID=A0AAE0K2A4_9PEZI|nr:hypothetical protein B0H63DRAFT_515250 [Podospora didyma]